PGEVDVLMPVAADHHVVGLADGRLPLALAMRQKHERREGAGDAAAASGLIAVGQEERRSVDLPGGVGRLADVELDAGIAGEVASEEPAHEGVEVVSSAALGGAALVQRVAAVVP